MNHHFRFWAALGGLLMISLSPLRAGITGVTSVGGTYALGDTISVDVSLEGEILAGRTIQMRVSGSDIYDNGLGTAAGGPGYEVVSTTPAPALAGPGPDTAAETDTATVSWVIPEDDGSLYNMETGYSISIVIVDDVTGNPVGSSASATPGGNNVLIDVPVNLVATDFPASVTYIAGTYEGGDIIEVTYSVYNSAAEGSDAAVRPLRPSDADEYRCRIFLTPEARYDAGEDFRLGDTDYAGDGGSFIPTGFSQTRRLVTTYSLAAVVHIDTLGRDYYIQPDDSYLDVEEYMTVTEQYLIPSNFSGTYFVGLAIDAVENLDEQDEDDNIFISNATPRVRIISGPASNTLPVSEVTDTSGNQVTESNGLSDEASINEDGSLIAFQSLATNLTPTQSYTYNGLSQIFVREVEEGTISLMSVSGAGVVGNGTSLNPAISTNGRYVAFESTASNLVNNDTNGFSDIFVRDIELGSTIRLTVNANGVQANGASFTPSISETGRFVAFESVASNLDLNSPVQPGPGTGRIQIYVVDRDVNGSGSFDQEGNVGIYLVSFDNAGALADTNALTPVLSLDGASLAFVTNATNFPLANGFSQIYLRNLDDGQPTGNVGIVSRRLQNGAAGNGNSSEPVVNGGRSESNGLQIAFSSEASNLVTGDTNGVSDIFVRDFSTSGAPVTKRVSVSNNRKSFTSIQFVQQFPFWARGTLPANNPGGGDFITLNDGTNAPVTFTFGGNVTIGANAAITRDNLVAAINATPNLLITAASSNSPFDPYPDGATGTNYGAFPGLTLINDVPGVQGNQVIAYFSAADVIYVYYDSMAGGGTQGDNSLTSSVEQGVPTGSLQPTIDRSGALIAFRSLEQNLAIDPDNGEWIRPLYNRYSNVFLRDRDVNGSGTFDTDGNTDTLKISVSRFGYPTTALLDVPSSGSSRFPAISADGGSIAFSTDADNVGSLRFGATNVDPLDGNDLRDIFLYLRDINRDSGTGTDLRPTVTVSSPSVGDDLSVNEQVILEALVSPINASNAITVEFYVNGVRVGSDSTSPYIANWTPTTTGNFSIVARVNEAGVGTAVSDAVSVTVSTPTGVYADFTAPIEGNAFALGSAISITVDAGVTNTTGTIDSVTISQNGVDIATLTSAPYTTTFTPTSNGQVTLKATATASVNGGTANATATDSISITVATNPPTVVFTSPQEGDDLILNSPTEITVTANSENANVAYVEFFADGVSLGTDDSFPYLKNYTPTSVGEVILQAFVTDTDGVRAGNTITVDVLDINAGIVITSPKAGVQFSVYDSRTVTAQVTTGGRTVRRVDFYADDDNYSSTTFSPYRAIYEPDNSGNVILTARVSFTDGVTLTSEGVPVQVTSNPRVTATDFVAQTLTDFFAVVPDRDTVQDYSANVKNNTASKANFVATVTTSSDFQSAVSIMGAFITQLYRFPTVTEYQTAITGAGFDGSSGSTTTTGAIQIGVPSVTDASITQANEQDEYYFTTTTAQNITLYSEGPTDTVGTLRDSSGQIIALDDQSGIGNNFQITEFLPAGTYYITVEGWLGLSTGIYTLYVQGTSGVGSGVTTGTSNFDLEGLVNAIFSSDEYLTRFGQLPDLTGPTNGSAGDLNRRAIFRQLWSGKYGSDPSTAQQQQASLRMVLLGGLDPFTSVLISEQNIVVTDLTTGTVSDPQPLIGDASSMRGLWTTAVLMLTLWNEQPTNADLQSLRSLGVSDQVEAIITDPRYTSRFADPYSLLFEGNIQSDGWINSSWLDTWVNQNSAPWYLSLSMGYLYTTSSVPDSVWFYVLGAQDWMWTSDEVYPWVFFFSKLGGGWFYTMPDPSANLTWFISADGTQSFAIPSL